MIAKTQEGRADAALCVMSLFKGPEYDPTDEEILGAMLVAEFMLSQMSAK